MKIEQVLELYEPLRISGNESAGRIQSAFRKLHANLQFRSQCAVVSISGGSDSDVMLDMIQALEPEKNYTDATLHYVWFNTGLEYTATKEHLSYLEEKYGITIERIRAKTPVPLGCKEYGQPFISKRVSQYIGRLQSNGFNFKMWGNESFDFLLRMYPNCTAALLVVQRVGAREPNQYRKMPSTERVYDCQSSRLSHFGRVLQGCKERCGAQFSAGDKGDHQHGRNQKSGRGRKVYCLQ